MAGFVVVAVLGVGFGVCFRTLTILTHSAILKFQNYTHTSLRKTHLMSFFYMKKISLALSIRPNNLFR